MSHDTASNVLNGVHQGVSLHMFVMKCDRSIHLIEEAFMCNLPRSDLTETRILFDTSDIQLLRAALKTQDMACVHIQCRGMMNGLLSGVQQSAFI